MARESKVEHSKKMSWLLRHAASSQGVVMDAAGWTVPSTVGCSILRGCA